MITTKDPYGRIWHLDSTFCDRVENFLSDKDETKRRFLRHYHQSLGKDIWRLNCYNQLSTEIDGVIEFLQQVFGLEAYKDINDKYHLKIKEYY